MTPIRILLADDHPVTHAGTRQMLASAPDLTVVGEAMNGEEAVRLAQALQPDILLLDMSMPGMHGIEVARVVHGTQPQVRIVVLTGYALEPYLPALRRLGVDGYLSKSALPGELIEAVRAAHSGRPYVQSALATLVQAPAEDAAATPTARELEVVSLVAEGLSNTDIAQRMVISERTVRFHLDNIFRKSGAASRTALTKLAHQYGWLTLDRAPHQDGR